MPDFERPLNGRGLRAALQMGKLLRANNFEPDLIISSPATRARDTAELVKDAAQFAASIQFEPRIYEASLTDLLEIISQTPSKCGALLLVGHNPGLENLVECLTGEMREMPTAAIAEIDLEINAWSEIKPTRGNLKKIYKPKETENFE